MQKKLLAVAVAGALGAPAVVMAQTSTVQIYGRVYVEYSFQVDQGNAAGPAFNERSTADFIQTPGSAIGFKGEEKLGGGLSAWFQCESTADPRGQGQEGWCSRNSALGLKGGFGNLFVGNWDAPFKRTGGPGLVGANQTGIFGASFLTVGGSTTTSFPAAGIAGAGSGGRGIFFRRQNSSINYDSPNFGGFQVLAMFTASQPSTGTLDAGTNTHPRIMSLGGQYRAGPIFIGAGYERHKDSNGPTAPPVVAGSLRDGADDAWHLAAAYTWGPVKVGGLYTRQELEGGTIAAPTNVKYRAWHVGVDWRIVGPHGLLASYTKANDSKGTPGAFFPGGAAGSGVTRPGVPTAAALAASPSAGDNGAKLWQIRYAYNFSKRTQFTAGYVKLNNDSAGAYVLGGLSGTPVSQAPGNNQDAWAVAFDHRF